jgi:hypothetical protein
MENSLYQALDIIVTSLSVVASVLIAFILFRTSKKIEKQSYSNELKLLWSQIDSTVLSNNDLLIEADKLIHPDKVSDTIEIKRRRWLCYMLQNAIAITHNGIEKKLMPDPENADKSLSKTLQTLGKNIEYKQVLDYCHEKSLKERCEKI